MDEDILRAHIASFFQSQDASERANAEAALSSFSKSDGSWSVLLRVLERDDATAVETLFCARTLHVLLRRCVAKEERTQASHAAFTERDWIDLRSRVLKLTMRLCREFLVVRARRVERVACGRLEKHADATRASHVGVGV